MRPRLPARSLRLHRVPSLPRPSALAARCGDPGTLTTYTVRVLPNPGRLVSISQGSCGFLTCTRVWEPLGAGTQRSAKLWPTGQAWSLCCLAHELRTGFTLLEGRGEIGRPFWSAQKVQAVQAPVAVSTAVPGWATGAHAFAAAPGPHQTRCPPGPFKGAWGVPADPSASQQRGARP